MLKNNQSLKPIAYLAVVVLTLAVTIANGVLVQLGLDQNNQIVFSFALALAILLCTRNPLFIGAVLAGIAAMNLPDATLLRYNLDRDVVTAFVCAMIVLPAVSSLFSR